jgi:hypothetical protein
MDAVTDALAELAASIDGLPLSDGGGGSNMVRAVAGTGDGATPPYASVTAAAVRWAGTGRSDGTATLEADVLLILPGASGPVASALAHRALSSMRAQIQTMGGKTLAGTVSAWRLMDATLGETLLGGRSAPSITFRLELWLGI